MHRLSSPSRFLLSFMESAKTHRWPPAVARRVSPLMMSPNQPVSRVFRFPRGPQNMSTLSRVESDESRRLPMSSANVVSVPLDNIVTREPALEVRAGDDPSDKDAHWNTSEVGYINHDTCGHIVKHTDSEEDGRSAMEDHKGDIGVTDEEFSDDELYWTKNVIAKSGHRDGSMYRGTNTLWKKEFRITDRNETRLEAMTLSDSTNCIICNGTCIQHAPGGMMQILSLELAEITVDGGLVELYGYLAVRDGLDRLLNYVVNISRDQPIIVEQGSLINMAGPKRGIDIMDHVLVEYDIRIKAGEQEKDDLQLIDGASMIGGPFERWDCPFTIRIPGDCGRVDLNLAYLSFAVEATVEFFISEVQNSFNLSLGCLTSGLDKEIRLFDGAIAESCCLKRSVVAVVWGSLIDLKFKLDSQFSSSNQHCCPFKPKLHGHDTQEIKTDFALISVKVTWSTLPAAL